MQMELSQIGIRELLISYSQKFENNLIIMLNFF